MWDASSGKLVRTFEGHKAAIGCIAISQDGEIIAAGSGSYTEVQGISDNTVMLWEVSTGRLVTTLVGHQKRVISVAFSPNSQRVVTGSLDGSVRVWSASRNQQIQSINAQGVHSVSFSPDGRTVVSTSYQDGVIFWDVDSGQPIKTIHSSGAGRVSFTSDWHLMSFGTYPPEVWDVENGRKLKELQKSDGQIESTVISDDGLFLAGVGFDTVSIWDVKTGTILKNFTGQPVFTTGVAFNSAGDKLAWGRGDKVYVWDMLNNRPLYTLEGHSTSVNEVAFSPDGQTLASCSDAEVILWSLRDGRMSRTVSQPRGDEQEEWDGNQSLSFSPDGKILAVGGWTDTMGIRLWSTSNWRLLRTLRVTAPQEVEPQVRIRKAAFVSMRGGPTPQVHSIAFSPDGHMLAAGDEFNNVSLWNLATGRIKPQVLKGHTYPVNSVAFSNDGTRLVSGSFDETVKIWSIPGGKILKTLAQHEDRVTSVRFSLDGQSIISGGADQTVRLWDARDGSQKGVLEGHAGAVTSVAFSPNGRIAASGGLDGRVQIWSVQSKAPLLTIATFDDGGWISFSPDGFYTGSPGAERHLAWRMNGKIYQGTTMTRRLARADVLLARVSGSEPPFIPENKEFSPIPPTRNKPSIPASEEMLRREWQGRRSYALVIGNNKYENLQPLENAVRDATAIANVLRQRYGFEVDLLEDATHDRIMNALQKYESPAYEKASLLIYYAGHGTYRDMDKSKVGFWQPVDADEVNRTKWVSSDSILQSLKLMKFSHVLIVSDSCFSGALIPRGAQNEIADESPEELLDLMEMKSRTLISSGGLHPSFDKGEDGYSIFGGLFLEGLKNMPRRIFTADRLFFEYIYGNVRKKAGGQHPGIFPITGFTDDDNGGFIFIRRQ
jgi:WD40 repeat protein